MKPVEQSMLENPMRRIRVEKVVLNIGVGRSGEQLEKAKAVIKLITNAEKVRETRAKETIREFGIRKGEPIGVMVTLRGKKIEPILPRLLKAIGMRLNFSSFSGNTVSFGIKEQIQIPGISYDPSLGIFGMDVTIVLERPGYRVARRKRRTSRIGARAQITSEEAAEFLSTEYGVQIVR